MSFCRWIYVFLYISSAWVEAHSSQNGQQMDLRSV